MSDTRLPLNFERFKLIPTGKMAFQGEREQGGLGMCFNVESMARVGSFYNYNPTTKCSQWERLEHELCRQIESHNSGAIAPQRNTERAAINSTIHCICAFKINTPIVEC